MYCQKYPNLLYMWMAMIDIFKISFFQSISLKSVHILYPKCLPASDGHSFTKRARKVCVFCLKVHFLYFFKFHFLPIFSLNTDNPGGAVKRLHLVGSTTPCALELSMASPKSPLKHGKHCSTNNCYYCPYSHLD